MDVLPEAIDKITIPGKTSKGVMLEITYSSKIFKKYLRSFHRINIVGLKWLKTMFFVK